MPARIEIGRTGKKGRRGWSCVPPSEAGALKVNCTVISDPFHKQGTFAVPEVARRLEELHGTKFTTLVEKVVQGILDDRVVHVYCMMGKNRSQAVAWKAREKLREDHPAIAFVGPVALSPIELRFV
jgi:hypothetical protein